MHHRKVVIYHRSEYIILLYYRNLCYWSISLSLSSKTTEIVRQDEVTRV